MQVALGAHAMNRRMALFALIGLTGCARQGNLASNAKKVELRMTEAQVHVLFMTSVDYSGVAAVNVNGKQILSNIR